MLDPRRTPTGHGAGRGRGGRLRRTRLAVAGFWRWRPAGRWRPRRPAGLATVAGRAGAVPELLLFADPKAGKNRNHRTWPRRRTKIRGRHPAPTGAGAVRSHGQGACRGPCWPTRRATSRAATAVTPAPGPAPDRSPADSPLRRRAVGDDTCTRQRHDLGAVVSYAPARTAAVRDGLDSRPRGGRAGRRSAVARPASGTVPDPGPAARSRAAVTGRRHRRAAGQIAERLRDGRCRPATKSCAHGCLAGGRR